MKVLIKGATDSSNKRTQTLSKKFTSSDVADKATTGTRKGETMAQIVQNIFNDPDITFSRPDAEGNETIYYKGTNIGWLNKRRGIGDINNKVYTQIKHAAKARKAAASQPAPAPVDEDEPEDAEYDEDEENEGEDEE